MTNLQAAGLSFGILEYAQEKDAEHTKHLAFPSTDCFWSKMFRSMELFCLSAFNEKLSLT